MKVGDVYTGFFEEDPGRFSMLRLINFINTLVASWVTISGLPPFSDGLPGYDYITLVFGLWAFAYGGKNAAKYIENLKPKK